MGKVTIVNVRSTEEKMPEYCYRWCLSLYKPIISVPIKLSVRIRFPMLLKPLHSTRFAPALPTGYQA